MAARDEMCNFDPKNEYLGPKVNFLYGSCVTPIFGRLGLCHFVIISTLNFQTGRAGRPINRPRILASRHLRIFVIKSPVFGPFSTTWWDRPGHQKMTHNDNRSGPGQNYRETAVFTFGRHVFFWPKMRFIPIKHPKFLIFILEKGNFFFEQLFPVVARSWLELRSECFLGPKSQFLAQKSDFYYTTPILINGLFVALGETVHFAPLCGGTVCQ